MKKIVTCLLCEKEFVGKWNSRFCPDCSEENKLIKKETKEFGKWTILTRDDFRCVYCGKSSIEDGAFLCLDHIVPYNDSKDNTIYNLVTACFECNSTKGDRHLSKEVYDRIIQRNIERNKGISMAMQEKINALLDKYFTIQKRMKNEDQVSRIVK